MSTVTDLAKERQIARLIDNLGEHIASHPEIAARTFAYLDGELPMSRRDDTMMLSIRVPRDLMADLDRVVIDLAYHEGRRINRNALLVDLIRRFVDAHKAKDPQ